MPQFKVLRTSTVPQSFRTAAVQGKFDIPSREQIKFELEGELPSTDEQWQIGVLCGPSGSGKSSILQQVYKDTLYEAEWNGLPIVDNFPKQLTVDEVVGVLSSVGLNSVPVWLLPFHQLSMGQQFRATIARGLSERAFLCLDEFTSVVDRTVAKSVCVSLKKFLKRNPGIRLVVASCHYDILEWLQPDWVFDTNTRQLSRDCLRRPPIEIIIREGSTKDWKAFSANHYMTAEISISARVYLAYVRLGDDATEYLAGFFSTMPAMGMTGWDRGHRTVVLPDYQGLGIGNRMIEAVAEWLWKTKKRRFRATTSAYAIVQHRIRNPHMWRLVQKPVMKSASGNKKMRGKTSAGRLSTSWEYIPEEKRNGNILKA